MKICRKCKKPYPAPLEYFYKHTVGKDNLCAKCRGCYYLDNYHYYHSHKEHLQQKSKEYYQANKEHHCAVSQRWKSNNRQYINKYSRRRITTNEQYAIINRLRIRLTQAYKSYSKHSKTSVSKDLGIDWQAIYQHLGKCPGPRCQYHIDHIIPLSRFNFGDPVQIKQAFAPENHRWLPAKENLRKSNKLEEVTCL